MPPSSPKSIAVIGGGVTGLTAAFRLHEGGFRVKVFERSSSTGGAIGSIREGGYLIETGPNSLQLGAAAARRLVSDLGLDAAVVPANPLARRRFLVRGGRLVPVPASLPGLVRTPLFSVRAKLAIVTELLTRPRVRTTDLTLAELFRSHFNQEVVDYAVNPVVAGLFAGDPAKLSAKAAFPALWNAERTHGSLIRGLMAAGRARAARGEPAVVPVVSFREGLQTLTRALTDRLPDSSVALEAMVETIIPGPPHRLVWRRAGQTPATEEFDAVVLAVPAGALAQLTFGTLGERPLASLDTIPVPPVSSLFLGYRRADVAHPLDGFGGLVPAIERREVLGILFSSTLFPERAPDGHVALTVFAGGSRQPEIARLPTAQLVQRISRDLRELLGVSGEPAFVRHTFWPRAIPQYVLGYERWLEAIDTVEKALPRVFIGGNARDGISVPDCIKSGERLAQTVTAALA